MGGMNSNLRKKAYHLCKQRDGEKCNICSTAGHTLSLVIDHIDNNKQHNQKDGTNWQLLCRHCNYIKNPRRKKGQKQVKRRYIDQYMSSDFDRCSPEMQKNRTALPVFKRWLYAKVLENTAVPKKEAINGGAQKANCSPKTIAERYLPPLLSCEGPYTLDDTDMKNVLIIFKPKQMIGVMPTDNGIIDMIERDDG